MATILKTPKAVSVATTWQVDMICIEPEYRGIGRCTAQYSVRDEAGNILSSGEAAYEPGMKHLANLVAEIESVIEAKMKSDGLE